MTIDRHDCIQSMDFEMNSTIFVQSSIRIPDGPISEYGTPVKGLALPKKRMAAVIRPATQENGQVSERSGLEALTRIDPSSSKSQRQKLRTDELFAYVNWLKAKIEADQAESEVEVGSADVDPNRADRLGAGVGANASHLDSDSYFSTISAEEVPGDSKGNGTTSPDVAADASPSDRSIERVDPLHPSFVESVPTAHVSFSESDPELTNANSESTLVDQLDSEVLVKAVSQAIAAVMTDKVDADFEDKIRNYFESEIHARTVHSGAATSEKQLVESRQDTVAERDDETESLTKVDQEPVEATIVEVQTEAEQIATGILHDAKREIPTSVAAWDVEEFRWPVVSNQMIVSGGEAVDRLFQSTFEMITSSHHRVAVSATERGIGSTSIAISLARWAAACGKNVLLVDADIANPNLSQRVGLAPNLSWINGVKESLNAAEVIVRSQKTNICIMPVVTTAAQVIWPRCVYDNLGELLNSVQSYFDLVLLDIGPGSQLLDELSRPELLVDTTLLVHDGHASPKLAKMKGRFEAFGLTKFIVAENRAAQRAANVA